VSNKCPIFLDLVVRWIERAITFAVHGS